MKKTIAMLLAAAMTASLAACSSGAPAAATTAAPAATTAATTAAQTTAAPAASEAPAAETKAAETTAAAAEEYKPTWPKKTVTFTVPAAPGGGTDLAARVIAEYMQRVTGQAFNVNNDTSGGNMAALEKARHFKKDGYDLLFYHNNIILSWYQGKLNFNPMEEYTFVDTVSGTGAGPMVVLPTAPYQTADEFIAYAKEHPGEIRVGTELGKNGHSMMALMADALDIDLNFIDAGSSADQLTALLSGSVDVVMMTTAMIQQYVDNGDVVAIMTTGSARPEEFPDIPSFSDLGVAAPWSVWSTVIGPKDLDEEVIKSFCWYMEQMDEETKANLYKVSHDPVIYRSHEDTMELWKGLDESGRTICNILGTNVR